jgi:hypothetical protein
MENLFASISSPTGIEVLAFVGSLFFLAAGANQVLKLVDRNKEQPPPAATYVTLKECANRHEFTRALLDRNDREIEAIKNQITCEVGEVTRLAEARTGGLHERINKVLEAVSELRGEVRRLNQMR